MVFNLIKIVFHLQNIHLKIEGYLPNININTVMINQAKYIMQTDKNSITDIQ